MKALKKYFGVQKIYKTKKIIIFSLLTFVGVLWTSIEHNKKLVIDETPLNEAKSLFERNNAQITKLQTKNAELNLVYNKYKRYLFSEEEKQSFIAMLNEMGSLFSQLGISGYKVDKITDNPEYFNIIDIYLSSSSPQITKKLLGYFLSKYSDIAIKDIKILGSSCILEIYKQ